MESRFIKIPMESRFWRDFNVTSLANQNTFRVFDSYTADVMLKRLEETEGVDVLSSPRTTTLNGRQSQIKTVQAKTVISGFGAPGDTEPRELVPGLKHVSPAPDEGVVTAPHIDSRGSQLYYDNLELGTVMDLVPTLDEGGDNITLNTTMTFTRFLGYQNKANPDDPGPQFEIAQNRQTIRLAPSQVLVMGMMPEHKTGMRGKKRPMSENSAGFLVFVMAVETTTEGDPVGQSFIPEQFRREPPPFEAVSAQLEKLNLAPEQDFPSDQ